MNKTIKFLPLLATGLLAVGCQDYDAGFTEADIKTKQYADKFVQEFGQVDPNQDWSMATLVEANVNLPELQGSAKMNIMTGDPRLSSTRLLAQIMLENGKGQIKFDAIKGNNNVFVTVEQDGQYKVFGQYAIENGMLNMGDVTSMVNPAYANITRAFTNPAAKDGDEITTALTYQVVDHKGWKLGTSAVQTREEWIAEVKGYVNGNTASRFFKDETVRHFVKINGVDVENSTFILKDGTVTNEDPMITWNNQTKTLEEWKALINEKSAPNQYGYNNGDYPFEPSSITPNTAWHENTAFDWSNPVLKSGASEAPIGSVITYKGTTKTADEWRADLIANAAALYAGTYDGPWENEGIKLDVVDCSSTTSGATYVGLYPEDQWEMPDDAVEADVYRDEHIKLQYLSGVEKEAAEPWTIGEGYSLYGNGGFFQEQNYYWGKGDKAIDKTLKYGDTAEERKAVIQKIEEGFVITADGNPITIPFIYGATQNVNQFGYVIYDKDQDPLQQPHYILMNDARPDKNIYYNSWQGTAVTNMGLADFGSEQYGYTYSYNHRTDSEQAMTDYLAAANQEVYGTAYQLTYFYKDENGVEHSTFNIPAGKQIVFFIVGHAFDVKQENPSKVGTTYADGAYNYSLPELNKRIGHLYGNNNSPTYNEAKDNGAVKAVAWVYNDKKYLGFEDGGNDEDLNDIVFMVDGGSADNLLTLYPVKWHINLNNSHDTEDKDIYLLENKQAGMAVTAPSGAPKNGDKEFLGWSTSPTATEAMTTFPAVPVGGLCLYAVWKTDEESVNIKWHTNTDGKHHNGENGTTADDDLFIPTQSVVKGSNVTKPTGQPTAPNGKQFVGWATSESAGESDVLSDDQIANMTADTDLCFFAVYKDIDTPVVPDPEYISWMFACEDLGGTFDYDFNDVVWEVQKTLVGEEVSAVKVRLLAAGGTLPFTLKYNGTKICTKDEAFGTSTSPVNAGPGTVSKDVKEYTVSGISSDWTVSNNYTKFSVEVEGTGTSTMIQAYQKEETLNNKAPQVILVPGTWQWPTETTPINEAYLEFTEWVKDNNYVAWPTPVPGKTVTR